MYNINREFFLIFYIYIKIVVSLSFEFCRKFDSLLIIFSSRILKYKTKQIRYNDV